MSVFRKAMVYLGLVDDEEYYGDEVDYADDEIVLEESRAPAPTSRTARAAPEPGAVRVIQSGGRGEDAGGGVGTATRVAVKPVSPARVHVMEPTGFNDAQEVGDRLKQGQPVILNLQRVDRDLQRRLIDFSSGLAYALSGTMSKAADQVFLLTPSNVEVSDEEKERLQAKGLYRASRS